MKRRDFIKKGSAVVATTVVGSTLAGCGGGSNNEKTTPTGNTNPTPANPVTPTTPVVSAPITAPVDPTPLATFTKTLYITDGMIDMAQADPNQSRSVYFRGFSNKQTELNVPGQSIIVKEGDSVEFTITNTLNSTHEFKISSYNQNKQLVTLAETGAIAPGQTATVNFVARNPGTYFYHDSTENNRIIGLHGGFAIMPKNNMTQLFSGSRAFVQQLFWIFNDIDFRWNDAVKKGTTLPNKFTPQYFTINGLTARPPAPPNNGVASPESKNPFKDTMHDPRTMLVGGIGDRTLMRVINFGKAKHSMHIHANHLEWLRNDGLTMAGSNQNDPQAFLKDVIPLNRDTGMSDVIYPFDPPPDSVPPFTQQTILQAEQDKREIAYPMHLHDEQTQTANGSSYLFGALTDLYYKSTSVTKKTV